MQRDCIAIHQTKSINYLLTKLIREQFRCLKTERSWNVVFQKTRGTPENAMHWEV